jgi:hypothetical protein
VPAGVDAICLPSGRGITGRKADGTGNRQFLVDSGDVTYIGYPGSPVDFYQSPLKPPVVAAASAPNGSLFQDSDNSNKLTFKDGSGTPHALY